MTWIRWNNVAYWLMVFALLGGIVHVVKWRKKLNKPLTHFSYWGLEIFLKHPKYMHMTQNYLFVIKCRINYLLMSNLKGIFFSILFHMQPRVTYYDLLVQHIVKNRKIIYIWSQYLVIWYLFSYVIENISHFRIFIKKKWQIT